MGDQSAPQPCSAPKLELNADLAIVRPAAAHDVDALFELAARGGHGLTNLPANRAALSARIDASEQAICCAKAREAGAGIILMTELRGRIVGTSCIFARIGVEWPFYSYRLTRQAQTSRATERRSAQLLLNLANDFDGEAEVGGLLIDPEIRGRSIGKITARARYLFIAQHRHWFGRRVIAELRGWQDSAGRSPVWEAIGRHFYDMPLDEADRFGSLHGNQFIADLGPRYPLYVSLLPKSAQDSLGRPHDEGRRAHDMLLAEGFRADGYVDIFDGGPTLVAEIDSLRAVQEARAASWRPSGLRSGERKIDALVATGHGVDFRATRLALSQKDESVFLALEQVDQLRAVSSAPVQWIPF